LNATPALLPVTLSAPNALTPLARAEPASPASEHTTPGVIEIELEAAHVHVRGAVDATALRTVLEVLAQR
jgi:hypothetical protein